jgi:hypothetical protein
VITNNSVEATERMAVILGFDTHVGEDACFTFARRDYEGRLRAADEVHAMSLAKLVTRVLQGRADRGGAGGNSRWSGQPNIALTLLKAASWILVLASTALLRPVATSSAAPLADIARSYSVSRSKISRSTA